VNHLSTWWKINLTEIPKVAASEIGGAQTVVFTQRGCRIP
jgi:hypothetical protein